MLKGIFLKDIQWFLILDLLEGREEEIETKSEFRLCALCIENITTRLRVVNNDSVGVILPTEGWYYILDLIDNRAGEIEEEEEEETMLEEAQSIIWEGLNTDGMPFPEV